MNKNNGRRRKKTDRFISIRLTDDDADLTDWWDGLADGEGSQTVKDILRGHIGAQKPDELAPLREGIERMNRYMDKLISQGVVFNGNGAAEPSGELDPEEAQRRANRILKNKW